jgi:hypothetical protein
LWHPDDISSHETSKNAKEAYNQRFRGARALKKVEKSQDSR